jgi:hypothetical protein
LISPEHSSGRCHGPYGILLGRLNGSISSPYDSPQVLRKTTVTPGVFHPAVSKPPGSIQDVQADGFIQSFSTDDEAQLATSPEGTKGGWLNAVGNAGAEGIAGYGGLRFDLKKKEFTEIKLSDPLGDPKTSHPWSVVAANEGWYFFMKYQKWGELIDSDVVGFYSPSGKKQWAIRVKPPVKPIDIRCRPWIYGLRTDKDKIYLHSRCQAYVFPYGIALSNSGEGAVSNGNGLPIADMVLAISKNQIHSQSK